MLNDVPLDFALNAPPGTLLVVRFTKMEMLNIERSSWTNSRPESALAEIDSYSHPTFRNLHIEGHIRVNSSASTASSFRDAFLLRLGLS